MEIMLELLELRKLAADNLVQNSLKLTTTYQPDTFLNPCIDPVVLLNVQTQRVQRLLGDTDLATDADDCRPVNDWHRAYKRVRSDRHNQHERSGQSEKCKLSRVLSHRFPFDSSTRAMPTLSGGPFRVCK